ncbi:MAG: SDR family oxidoreductase [Pseudonocardia sp.]|nr:SDR family oxidoreductase [Pseudonocardia sp.]
MTDVLVVIGVGGMGEAIARRLGSGQRVLLADFNQETLHRVADSMRGDGYTVDTREVDVSSRDSLAALARTASEVGAVKQVAHTAGVSPEQAPIDVVLRVDLAGVAYSIAKRATQLRVQAASLAWGERGARINSISPGVICTPMGQQELSGESGGSMRAMVSASGTKRLGTPADIANAAAFLLGPESTFITGCDLLVDGGVVAAVQTGASTPWGSRSATP